MVSAYGAGDCVEWTDMNRAHANAEGWDIFDCSGSDHGSPQIQRIDELDIFTDDTEAWELIVGRAVAGSRLHDKALRFIAQDNVDEYERIQKWCADRRAER